MESKLANAQKHEAFIASLLNDLSSAISQTPKKIESDFSKLISTLDILLDEMKSTGCKDWTTDNLSRAFTTLKTISDYQQVAWQPVQTMLYALVYIIGQWLVTSSKLEEMTRFVSGFHASTKREIQFAASFVIGELAAQLTTAFLPIYLPLLRSALSSSPSWGALEGSMMSVGSVLSRYSADASEQAETEFKKVFDELLGEIIQASSNTAFPSFSNYVRLQACKSLKLLVSSRNSRFISPEKQQEVRKVLFARLTDENTEVRRAAPQLLQAYASMINNKHNNKSGTAEPVENLVGDILKNLEEAKSWESRQGFAASLSYLAHPLYFFYIEQPGVLPVHKDSRTRLEEPAVKLLSSKTKENMIRILTTQIRHTHPESKEKESITRGANAAAARALTALYLIYLDTKDEQVATLWNDKIKAEIEYLLSASEPTLLDAGGVCLQSLILKHRKFMEPHLAPLLNLLFKNKFHPSLPIRDSALRNFKMTVGDERAFLTDQIPNLLKLLLADAKSKDSEVRESVFKALEELFSKNLEYLQTPQVGVDIVQQLLAGASNKTGRNSEYPRMAAFNALSAFLQASASTSALWSSPEYAKELDKFVNTDFTSKFLSCDDHDLIATALTAFTSLMKSTSKLPSSSKLSTLLGNRDRLLTPLISLSYHSSNEHVKVNANILLFYLFGNLKSVDEESRFTFSSGQFVAVFAGMKKWFGLADDPDGDIQDEDRERNSKVFRYLAEYQKKGLLALSAEDIKKILPNYIPLLHQSLFAEPNRSSPVILANSLGLFLTLLANPNFVKSVKGNAKYGKNVQTISNYLLLTLSDFSFSPDSYNVSEESLEFDTYKDADDDEAEDEEGEDNPTPGKKINLAIKDSSKKEGILIRSLVIIRIIDRLAAEGLIEKGKLAESKDLATKVAAQLEATHSEVFPGIFNRTESSEIDELTKGLGDMKLSSSGSSAPSGEVVTPDAIKALAGKHFQQRIAKSRFLQQTTQPPGDAPLPLSLEYLRKISAESKRTLREQEDLVEKYEEDPNYVYLWISDTFTETNTKYLSPESTNVTSTQTAAQYIQQKSQQNPHFFCHLIELALEQNVKEVQFWTLLSNALQQLHNKKQKVPLSAATITRLVGSILHYKPWEKDDEHTLPLVNSLLLLLGYCCYCCEADNTVHNQINKESINQLKQLAFNNRLKSKGEEGKALLFSAFALVPLLQLAHPAGDDKEKQQQQQSQQEILQFVSDVYNNDDINVNLKGIYVLPLLPYFKHKSQQQFFLPSPTPPPENKNETFSKFA